MQLTHFKAGIDQPFFLIAGPCVIEGETLTQEIAGRLKEITTRLKVNYKFMRKDGIRREELAPRWADISATK